MTTVSQADVPKDPLSVLFVTAFVFVVYRFGLLSMLLFLTFADILTFTPVTLDFSTWNVLPTVVVVLVIIAVTVYGFATSTAGQLWTSHATAASANA